jgi:hypothetical protein
MPMLRLGFAATHRRVKPVNKLASWTLGCTHRRSWAPHMATLAAAATGVPVLKVDEPGAR